MHSDLVIQHVQQRHLALTVLHSSLTEHVQGDLNRTPSECKPHTSLYTTLGYQVKVQDEKKMGPEEIWPPLLIALPYLVH